MILRLTLALMLAVAASTSCARENVTPVTKEFELGASRVQVIVPAGWEPLDQGKLLEIDPDLLRPPDLRPIGPRPTQYYSGSRAICRLQTQQVCTCPQAAPQPPHSGHASPGQHGVYETVQSSARRMHR